MTRTTIVSGGGDYTDPWHPFRETSAAIGGILSELGHDVAIEHRVDDTLASLVEEGNRPELLVLNAGHGVTPPPLREDVAAGLLAYLGDGRPFLVMHVASTLFPDWGEWDRILGRRWVHGVSMHPDWGLGQIRVETGRHPIVADVPDFEILDERYSYLQGDIELDRLAWHEHDGLEHPLLWARHYGSARIVYDALGHEPQSYESPEHRTIVARSAQWLLGELD